MARKRLGTMLIEAGVLDEDGLRRALADQSRWGRALGRTLVELGLVSEDQLVEVLSGQLHVERVDLDQLDIPQAVIELVPASLAREHSLVPFAQPMKFLDVAMVDPTNLGVIDELRIRSQLNIRPFLVGPRQVERAIARYYGHGVGLRPEVTIPFDGPNTYGSAGPARADRPTSATLVRDRHPARVPIADHEGLRPFPRDLRPPGSDLLEASVQPSVRDAEINALQVRLSTLEALVARDEQVLRKLLSLLIEKGVATREEILERLG